MGDLDNGIKALMDWLQRVELIEDDRFCDRILAQWGRFRSMCGGLLPVRHK